MERRPEAAAQALAGRLVSVCPCLELVLTVEMGVPKFYRWISERYPCLSEVVKEHQVGERGPAARKAENPGLLGPLCDWAPLVVCRWVADRGAQGLEDAWEHCAPTRRFGFCRGPGGLMVLPRQGLPQRF